MANPSRPQRMRESHSQEDPTPHQDDSQQFQPSKLGKHSSSRRTRQVSKDVKRMSLKEAESFTTDQVTSAIKICRSSRAYGPDSLSIFHLKSLGPLATEHLTALYNDSFKSCRLPLIWMTSLVFPITKPGKDSSQGTSYRPISLLCPAAKVLEELILPSINNFISPAKDQYGFRPRHSTTSALLPQDSKLSPSLFNDYIADMPRPTPPVKRVCYAVDITVWATGPKIPQLESMINSYLRDVSISHLPEG